MCRCIWLRLSDLTDWATVKGKVSEAIGVEEGEYLWHFRPFKGPKHRRLPVRAELVFNARTMEKIKAEMNERAKGGTSSIKVYRVFMDG